MAKRTSFSALVAGIGLLMAGSYIATAAAAQQKTEAPQRIKVGGGVMAGNLISKVDPVYPPEAKQAGTQGTVRLQIDIGTDGKVERLNAESGPDVLVQAAVEAVRQWTYKPVLLNGQPVEVTTTVDVNFTLSQ
jgi:protein TonB